jgi:hypothetical protein
MRIQLLLLAIGCCLLHSAWGEEPAKPAEQPAAPDEATWRTLAPGAKVTIGPGYEPIDVRGIFGGADATLIGWRLHVHGAIQDSLAHMTGRQDIVIDGGIANSTVSILDRTDLLQIRGNVGPTTWLWVHDAGRIEIDGDVTGGELWLHSTGPIVITGDVGPVIINYWAPSIEIRGKQHEHAAVGKGNWWAFADTY